MFSTWWGASAHDSERAPPSRPAEGQGSPTDPARRSATGAATPPESKEQLASAFAESFFASLLDPVRGLPFLAFRYGPAFARAFLRSPYRELPASLLHAIFECNLAVGDLQRLLQLVQSLAGPFLRYIGVRVAPVALSAVKYDAGTGGVCSRDGRARREYLRQPDDSRCERILCVLHGACVRGRRMGSEFPCNAALPGLVWFR